MPTWSCHFFTQASAACCLTGALCCVCVLAALCCAVLRVTRPRLLLHVCVARSALQQVVGDFEYFLGILPDGSGLAAPLNPGFKAPIQLGRQVLAQLAGAPERYGVGKADRVCGKRWRCWGFLGHALQCGSFCVSLVQAWDPCVGVVLLPHCMLEFAGPQLLSRAGK